MTDAHFTDHFFETADGPRIHWRDYPAAGEETGLPVICLHGLTRNVRDFEDFAPMVAAKGRRVISISARGRGQSDHDPVVTRYQPPTYAGDVMALLASIGLSRAVFVGTSMGGLMIFIIASLQPGLVAAAVINDIGPEIATEGLDRIKSNVSSRDPVTDWADAAARTRLSNLAAFPKRDGDTAFWEDFARKTWVERDDGSIALAYDGALVGQMDEGGPLPDLWSFWEPFADIPTLVVRGGISDLLTPDTVAEMKRRKPDLVTVEVPDVGHAPFITEPEAWRAVEVFLGQVD